MLLCSDTSPDPGFLPAFKYLLFLSLLSKPPPFLFAILFTGFYRAATAFSVSFSPHISLSFASGSLEQVVLEQMTVISELGPLIAVFVAAIAGGVEAQFTPPQSSGCTGSVVNLSPCLSYVTGNSSFLAPNRACCSGLDTVVKNSATCLCQFISGSGNPLGIPINRTTALSLPGACNITAPSLSQCKAAGNPADAPGASPASSPAQATAGPAEAPPLAPSTTENPKGKVFPSARSPLSSGNISPAHSEDGNIPSASAKRSSGGAVAITPSMMMLGAVVGVISASMSIKW